MYFQCTISTVNIFNFHTHVRTYLCARKIICQLYNTSLAETILYISIFFRFLFVWSSNSPIMELWVKVLIFKMFSATMFFANHHIVTKKFMSVHSPNEIFFDIYGLVMSTISKRRRNEASILASFSIFKRNELVHSEILKDRSEATAIN